MTAHGRTRACGQAGKGVSEAQFDGVAAKLPDVDAAALHVPLPSPAAMITSLPANWGLHSPPRASSRHRSPGRVLRRAPAGGAGTP